MLSALLALFNTLRPRQNGRHFTDDSFKWIFLIQNVWIPTEVSLKFVPKGPINNIPALVQVMAWRLVGAKPLSEPMMVSLLTHICVTRPQWFKGPPVDCPHKGPVMLTFNLFFVIHLNKLLNRQSSYYLNHPGPCRTSLHDFLYSFPFQICRSPVPWSSQWLTCLAPMCWWTPRLRPTYGSSCTSAQMRSMAERAQRYPRSINTLSSHGHHDIANHFQFDCLFNSNKEYIKALHFSSFARGIHCWLVVPMTKAQ